MSSTLESPRLWRRCAPLLAAPLLALGALSSVLTGCAHGPSGGGPVVPNPNASNRLTVTMTLQQPVNDAYYYDFAFDDNDVSANGPVAIVGPTPLTNGVVGGTFSVLVQYRAGQYAAFRRTDLGSGNERLERASRAFVVPPTPGAGNTLGFTLDLDAKTDSGTRLFRAGAQHLDANFVTTTEIRRDPNDLRRKTYDAFGPFSAGTWFTFSIQGTRTFSNGETVREPANDVITDDTSNTLNLAQLDITDFTITVQRS